MGDEGGGGAAGGYEFTKPIERFVPAPAPAKAANPDKCHRCRVGTYRERKKGILCCASTIRICDQCGADGPLNQ